MDEFVEGIVGRVSEKLRGAGSPASPAAPASPVFLLHLSLLCFLFARNPGRCLSKYNG